MLTTPSNIPPPLGPARDQWPWQNPQPPNYSAAIDWPRITVVTPNYNCGKFIEQTIRSVLLQGYPNLDYWIIDGGSDDESLDIIEHYSDHLSGWISEPDTGQADAIVKGLKRADGLWFNWINSDDYLSPDALKTIGESSVQYDLIAGSTRDFIDNNGQSDETRKIVVCRGLTFDSILAEDLVKGIWPIMRWTQPAIWLKTEKLKQSGINTSLHYRFDWDMMVRYLAYHSKVRYPEVTLAHFRFHPDSKTQSLGHLFDREHLTSLQQLENDFSELPHFEKIVKQREKWSFILHARKRLADPNEKTLRLFFDLIQTAMRKRLPSNSLQLRRVLRHALLSRHRYITADSDTPHA